jgi:signal transduction histidine kinase
MHVVELPSSVVKRVGLDGLTIKAALAIGFSLTVSVWAFTGYFFTQRMSAVESDAAAIAARYMRAQEVLSNIGSQILVSSVLLRDALLDPESSGTERQRTKLDDTYSALDHELEAYVPVLDSREERAQISRLRDEIRSFRITAGQVLSSETYKAPGGARVALNTEVVPKRESIIRISEEIRALNRTALINQQAIIADIHRVAERRSWQWLGVALAISLGIAVLATAYSGHLEGRLRRQQAVEAQNSRHLQMLSAKLITAQEEERQTIARELHDEVGQTLTAIKLELAVAKRRLNASGAAGELLDDAQAIADSALHTVRDLSHLLHPALLDDLGLVAALGWYLESFSKRSGVHTRLDQYAVEARLPADVELAAYRIVQEATTNVARHANARNCWVTLRRDSGRLRITIEDDGNGFDANFVEATAGRRGLGLLGMRERAAQLKGTVRIDTALGAGTRVYVSLPGRPDTRRSESDG